jgi:Fe-S oxidoreductase
MSTLIFGALLVLAGGILGRTLYRRFMVLTKVAPVARFDRIPERLAAVAAYVLGQKKFVVGEQPLKGDRAAGWMHFFIFWGFSILAIQVVHMFVRGFVPGFTLPGFSIDLVGGPYLLLKDVIQAIVLAAVGVALFRWLVSHPPRLFGFAPAEDRLRGQSHGEAILILSFIGTIMISGFVYDGGHLFSAELTPELERERAWQPLSALVGSGLVALGGVGLAALASDIGWWLHNCVILVFMNLLPLSKHFHILTSVPNVFFRKLEPVGQLSKQDLENATTFGTSYINQFTWKQVLDMYSCTECGRCSSHCPATISGKQLAPRQLLLNLRDYLYEKEGAVLSIAGGAGSGEGGGASEQSVGATVGENVVGEKLIHDEVLWACTTCRACEEACPVLIEYVDKIVDMRRHLVQEESRFPTELTRTFKAMETQGNPWGIDAGARADWSEGLEVPTMAEKPDAEYLYFVGCAGSFDDRHKKTTQALARILKTAGVSFAILGVEEPCNGETARRIGNEYLFQTMAQMAVEVLNGYGVRKIITNCPHCFNTFKNDYPQFDGNYEVLHATEVVDRLIADGRITLNGDGASRAITYHDSCYLGRYNGVFDAPRSILSRIPGVQLREMERSRRFGMCCGAGGGRMWMEEEPTQRVNFRRVEQALETKPDAVAVACPFCMTMIDDGLKAIAGEESTPALDVMELVANSMKQ